MACDDSVAMPEYRRVWVAGGTYFFTVVLAERGSSLLVERIGALRAAVRAARAGRPFRVEAFVVLPDHLHCVWTLPPGDADFATRWAHIKTLFSRCLPACERVRASCLVKRERDIWQRRYWEHVIRDEQDLRCHVDYVHLNPVKHRLLVRAADWPYSSFHRYVRAGVYPRDWLGEQGAS